MRDRIWNGFPGASPSRFTLSRVFVQTASINQAHVGNTDLITQVASYNYHRLLASLMACKGYRIRAVIFLGDAKYLYENASPLLIAHENIFRFYH